MLPMEFVSYDIEQNDFRRAGAASRAIKEHLKRIGADAEAIRRTMIAAYEGEMNVVIHSLGGRLEASLSDERIDVNVVDQGPGIADIELAMTEGYSTAGAEARALGFGAGMGLPNIERNSDRLRVTSRVGEGTRVSFTVFLQPEITCAAPAISLYASADRCRDCRACLTACPTHALRVRDGRPMVLEHLCIDCAQCIAACTAGALTVRDVLPSLDDVTIRKEKALIVPQALLAGYGTNHPPGHVLQALERLGFGDIRTVAPFEEAVRDATLKVRAGAAGPATSDTGGKGGGGEARAQTGEATERTAAAGEVTGRPAASGATGAWATGGRVTGEAAPPGPVIVPVCPAVVNLVELKFPSLVTSLAPFDSPWEAVAASDGDGLACVVSCPAQRSALAASRRGSAAEYEVAEVECLLPEALRVPVMQELTEARSATAGAPTAPEATDASAGEAAGTRESPRADLDEDGLLVVTGVHHVMAALEEIENGLLNDITVLEAYACEGGCFGSPLLFEDHHVARRRWTRGRGAAEAAAGRTIHGALRRGAAVSRNRPYAARPGIRLDADMSRAIQKLGRLQALTRSLPGRDCGACGAPTCAALAEDIVMGRAGIEFCAYVASEGEEVQS